MDKKEELIAIKNLFDRVTGNEKYEYSDDDKKRAAKI